MKRVISTLVLTITIIFVLLACSSCSRPEYTVTFVLGYDRDNVVATVQSGNALFTPDAPDDDMVFAGWYLDEACNQPYMTTSLTADLTLYAKFIERGEHVVTFVYNDGVTENTTYVFSGVLQEPKEPSKEGYVFLGWRDSIGRYYDFTSETDAYQLTLVADWMPVAISYSFIIDKNDGSDLLKYTYKYGAKVDPEAPYRNGYIFTGWFTNPECTRAYDPTEPLTKNVTIYAGWREDISGIANRITDEVLLSTVEVNVTHKGGGTFSGTKTALSIGSGVIYRATTDRYYVITNHHVIEAQQGYTSRTYSVIDGYGKEHSAKLHYSSAEYDLAIISFEKGEDPLLVATLAPTDPEVGDMMIAVGSPGSLNNVVTYGELLKYHDANVKDSKVVFDVGWHNAPIDNGSSGGGVFNADLHLVGINFAASVDDNGEFLYGAFIQIERVVEFIEIAESKFSIT